MEYRIEIERVALKSLKKIPEKEKSKIIKSIKNLAFDPYPVGAKKLSGRDGWRIRIGNYRVIYEINDSILYILVLDVDHRKDIYK
jgi:mRNA interferase RelE/StbE